MCDVPVFYATTEGQTRRIAERIVERLRTHGLTSRAIAIISSEASQMDWGAVRGVCLAASLHLQKHQPEASAFARLHGRTWAALPSLFVSVSLSAASNNLNEVEAARRLAEDFGRLTGWVPGRVASVGGRLAYSQYNWLVKWIMRRIAVKEGASGDTSRDHEYTDWSQVDRLADQLALAVRGDRRSVAPGSPGTAAIA
jgi:menaquinone-dependent protoporphyrinogen oxidase